MSSDSQHFFHHGHDAFPQLSLSQDLGQIDHDSAAISEHLIRGFLSSSRIGCALFDRQLRYCYVNSALARINGISAEAHLGKTIAEMLGSFAQAVEPKLQHVFGTAQPLRNLEVTAQIPGRSEMETWMGDYLPIKDASGIMTHVFAIVIEVPKRTEAVIAVPIERTLYDSTINGHLHPATSANNRILRSWKEIANYTAASVRTVQRWERELGLPVLRLKARKGVLVMAFSRDVDHWLQTTAAEFEMHSARANSAHSVL